MQFTRRRRPAGTIHALIATVIAGLATVADSPRASAQDAAMFILDASGSMWGRVEGRTKIEAAREVMGELVAEVPDTVEIGFLAYGHRRKGDCADIEVIERPAAGAGPKIASRLPGLVPRGKTPISDALVAGTEALAFRGGGRSVVLVSDGIETCSADPCAVAESLAKADVELKIHVVGFDVDDKARAQLQCIAEKGRGQYFPAENAFELASALSTLTTSIVTAEPVPEPAASEPAAEPVAAPEVAPTAGGTKIRIAGPGTIGIDAAPWVKMPPYYWSLIDPETGEEITKTSEPSIKVKPGLYQAAWRHIEHGAQEVPLSEVVEVGAGERARIKVDTGLRLVPPAETARPYYWQLLVEDADLDQFYRERDFAAHYSLWDPVPVPAGRYRLVLRQSEHRHGETDLGPVDIEPGKLNEIVLDQGINLQWPDAWSEALGRSTIYYLAVTDAAGRTAKFSERGPIFLAPGTYRMTVRLGEHGWQDVDWGEIIVPESGFADPKLTSGITFLSQDDPDHTIWAINLDTESETSISGHWGPMALPAGRYRIDYRPGRGERYTIVEEVSVGEGEMIEAEM